MIIDNKEIWLDLPTNLEAFKNVFPNTYMVSSFGRIKGARASAKSTDGCLVLSYGDNASPNVTLCGPNKFRSKFNVKYIVMCTFDPRPDHMYHNCINIDGNMHNNNICNLMWDDYTRFGKNIMYIPAPTIPNILPGEIWIPMTNICDLSNAETVGYFISNNGRIYHTFHNYLGYGHVDTRSGYYSICILEKDGKQHHFQVHRLVMCMFEPRPDYNQLQVNHKNGNKQDNRYPENLEWVTPKQNIHHSYTNNLTYQIGESHSESLYSKDTVFKIMQLHLNGLQTGQIVDELYKNSILVSKDFVSDVKGCRTRVLEIVEYLMSINATPHSVLTEIEFNDVITMASSGAARSDLLNYFNVQATDIKGVVISVMYYIIRNNAYAWIPFIDK